MAADSFSCKFILVWNAVSSTKERGAAPRDDDRISNHQYTGIRQSDFFSLIDKHTILTIMNISRIHSVFFSATFMTKGIVQRIVGHMHADHIQHDITDGTLSSALSLGSDELLVVGVPSYSGRVPARAANLIAQIKGDGSPAIIVCSYGNRDYEDTLIELEDILTANGFRIISAAAFIARHSVFGNVASDRPDADDLHIVDDFGRKSWQIVSDITDTASQPAVKIRGNRPYRSVNRAPLYPTGDDTCIDCKKCAEECPAQAIAPDNPTMTDESRCISCGRCIVLCPVGSRNYHYPFFQAKSLEFAAANAARKEPELFFPSI